MLGARQYWQMRTFYVLPYSLGGPKPVVRFHIGKVISFLSSPFCWRASTAVVTGTRLFGQSRVGHGTFRSEHMIFVIISKQIKS